MVKKFLYFTDSHYQVSSPARRSDDYFQAVTAKFEEIAKIAIDKKVDFLITGGDTYNSPSPTPQVVRNFIRVFKDVPAVKIACLGNHEMLGHQVASVEDRMIGLLRDLRNDYPFRFLSNDEKSGNIASYADPDSDIRIDVMDYFHGIEGALAQMTGKVVQNAILAPHANIVRAPAIFPDHVRMDDLQLPYEIILCSHYHPQLGYYTNKWGNTFVSPGALSRGAISIDDLVRVPSVAFFGIDTEKGIVSPEILPLKCARPSEEVFDLESVREERQNETRLDEFIAQVKLGKLQTTSYDLQAFVQAISESEGASEEVKGEAMRALADVL